MDNTVVFDLPMNGGNEQDIFTRTGVPIACPVQLRIPGDEFLLLENARIRVTAPRRVSRRLVTVSASERRDLPGTVKESTVFDDYYFFISGFLKDHDLEGEGYPLALINRLNNICNHKREVEIQCPVATAFGVQYLAITKMTLEPPKGGWVEYSIEGWSDTPWSLEVK